MTAPPPRGRRPARGWGSSAATVTAGLRSPGRRGSRRIGRALAPGRWRPAGGWREIARGERQIRRAGPGAAGSGRRGPGTRGGGRGCPGMNRMVGETAASGIPGRNAAMNWAKEAAASSGRAQRQFEEISGHHELRWLRVRSGAVPAYAWHTARSITGRGPGPVDVLPVVGDVGEQDCSGAPRCRSETQTQRIEVMAFLSAPTVVHDGPEMTGPVARRAVVRHLVGPAIYGDPVDVREASRAGFAVIDVETTGFSPGGRTGRRGGGGDPRSRWCRGRSLLHPGDPG